jgi:hypothetical protein
MASVAFGIRTKHLPTTSLSIAFFLLLCGTKTESTWHTGPTVPVLRDRCGAAGEMIIGRGNWSTGNKTWTNATSVHHKSHMTSAGSPRWEIVRLKKYYSGTLVCDQRRSIVNTVLKFHKSLEHLFSSCATIRVLKRTHLHGDSYSRACLRVLKQAPTRMEECSTVAIYFNLRCRKLQSEAYSHRNIHQCV